MARVFTELFRVLVSGGIVAYEVGDIRGGKVMMEKLVLEAIEGVGFVPELVLVNNTVVYENGELLGRFECHEGHEHQSHSSP